MKSPLGIVTSKAMLLMCSADLPACAQVLNMKQYNGKHGCAYCKDEETPRPSSHLHRNWLYLCDPVECSHQNMISDAKKAIEKGEAVRTMYVFGTHSVRVGAHTQTHRCKRG